MKQSISGFCTVIGILGGLAVASGCGPAGAESTTSGDSGGGGVGGVGGATAAGGSGAALCSDGEVDGGESAVDCGGATECPRCADGVACVLGTDCAGEVCTAISTCCTPEPAETTCASQECGASVVNNCGQMVACPGLSGPCFAWSKSFGDNQTQWNDGIASDAGGNVFLVGLVASSIDFGGGALLQPGDGAYLAKLDAAGNHLWSKSFTGARIRDVQTDAAGNVVFAAKLGYPVDFGGGLIDFGSDEWNTVVVKLDGNGDFLWSHAYDNPDNAQLAVDPSGNVFIAGCFNGTLTVGPVPLVSAGDTDLFLAKLGPDGQPLWSKQYGDAGYQCYPGSGEVFVSADASGNVVFTGRFMNTADFGGGSVTDKGKGDVFITKVDAQGAVLWSQIHGDAAFQYVRAVTTDHADNLLVTGTNMGAIAMGGEVLQPGIFVIKLDPAGAHLWSRGFEAPLGGYMALAVSPSNDVFTAGSLSGATHFDQVLIPGAGDGTDIYLAKLGVLDGAPLWSRAIGSKGQASHPSLAGGARVVITGTFRGEVDFGLGIHAAAGGIGFEDVFVASLLP